MKKISFEIAKKMEKQPAGQAGIQLSSLKGDPIKAVLVLTSPSYDELKSKVSKLHAQGIPLTYRTRGRSLEVTTYAGPDFTALDAVFSYASQLDFAADGVSDVISFCAGCRGFLDGAVTLEEISFDKESLSLKASAELPDEEEPESFYASLMELLGRADMGVIKK